MKYLHYILCLFLLIFSGTAFGQKKEESVQKNKRQNSKFLLDQARTVQLKSPSEAIQLLEEAITSARQQKEWQVEGEAYVLLGNIYEQIDQNDLALQRYQQAMAILNKSKVLNSKAPLYQRMGQIYLERGQDNDAEENFKQCLEWSNDPSLTVICEEGLADVQLLRKDTNAVAAQLDYLTQNYALDSIVIARVEARRSQAYVQQNNYTKASEAFSNSINSLPKNKQIEAKDYAPIQQAQKDLLSFNTSSPSEKIAIQSNIVDNAGLYLSNDVQVMENLKITELYASANNYPEAEKFINVAKNLINDRTDVVIAADVYKKSSELNQNKGKIDLALEDLELYIKAKEKAIQALENDLNEQIEIVKGQQQIDLLQRDFDLEEKDKALLQSQLQKQKTIIGLLTLLLMASLVFFYFLYKNVKAKRKANQLLLLKSLRTQMNPHFIFNALNSVNNFIAKNDEKAANKFLSEFSRLMRKVLEYSQKDFITFEEEMELNELYLKLEHFRFRDKFEYKFQNNAKQVGYNLEVPPMLIQPFIENAVWHGLRYKLEKGQLEVSVNKMDKYLQVTIKDNGIGRKKSRAQKTTNQKRNKSTGLENVSRRIALINEIYGKNYTLNVSDLSQETEDPGTIVEINIPFED